MIETICPKDFTTKLEKVQFQIMNEFENSLIEQNGDKSINKYIHYVQILVNKLQEKEDKAKKNSD